MTKIIAFDFDGVLHKSVYYENYGQGHPDNKCLKSLKNNYKNFKDCKINSKIKNIILKEYKKKI